MARIAMIQRRQPTGQWTESTNQSGVLSEIYRITVPRGEVWMIDPNRPFIFIPLLKYSTTITATATSVDLTGQGGLIQLIDAADSNLTYGSPNFEAIYRNADDTQVTITSHDVTADTLGFAALGADTACTIFAPPDENGLLEIGIEDPRGLGKLRYPIAQLNTRIYLQWNLWKRTTGFGLSCPFPIPEDFDIVFYLDANWTIGWGTPYANNIAVKNNLLLPIKVLPRARYDAALERRVRNMMLKLSR